MKPNRENLLPILARMLKSGQLRSNGPISVFVQDNHPSWLTRRHQVVVTVRDAAVFVRCSRLPFIQPLVFTLEELSACGDA